MCSHLIISQGAIYIRPRWASLFGNSGVAILLRYLDAGLIHQWNFEHLRPELSNVAPAAPNRSGSILPAFSNRTLLERLKYE